jgi:hypothetical protein
VLLKESARVLPQLLSDVGRAVDLICPEQAAASSSCWEAQASSWCEAASRIVAGP